jgi:hypothetical protein
MRWLIAVLLLLSSPLYALEKKKIVIGSCITKDKEYGVEFIVDRCQVKAVGKDGIACTIIDTEGDLRAKWIRGIDNADLKEYRVVACNIRSIRK